jgi:hypothetical protein
MSRHARSAAVVAIALLAIALTTASAGALNMSVAPAGRVRAASSGSLTFEGGGMRIECQITLGGTISRGPIVVREGAQIGETTELTIGTCSGGRVERVLLLPWAIKIASVLGGAGPTGLTGILFTLVGAAFKLSVFGGFVNCLYMGTTAGLAALTPTARGETRYTMGSVVSLREVEIPLITGGLCPTRGHFIATFLIEPAQTYTFS